MRYLYLFLLILLVTIGCSSNGTPISPQENSGTLSEVPIIGLSESADTFNAIGLLGAYELSIDPIASTADMVPMRTSSIGESYIVNGLAFFTISPCSRCMKIKSISMTANGDIQLTYDLRHPFQPGDPFKPPSGLNRLDLDVFDVALLVHPKDTTPDVFTMSGVSAYTGKIADNAGFTTELTEVIGDPAALPYVLPVDDNLAGTNTYNKFAMGAQTLFNVTFKITDNMNFELFLTMGYGSSAKKTERLHPKYYNPEFNRKSAWKVVVTPPNGNDPPSNTNTWSGSDTTTLFPVTVKVFDWQIGANVNPDLVNLDDIHAASGVSEVSLDIPGMFSSVKTSTTADSGTGKPDDPLVYTLNTANENALAPGQYWALVKVSDERTPGESVVGGETDTMATTPDGIRLSWKNIPEFATYQAFMATVVGGCGPIEGSITSPNPCPVDLSNSAKVDFVVTASSGNGGDPITLYEVDYDYDGVTFEASDSNTDGIFNDVGPFTVPDPCDSNVPYNFTVAFRATDSCIPPNITVFTSCQVTVTECCGPVGDVQVIIVNRGEDGADPEQITSVDFDWDDNPCAVEYAFERADGYTGTGWTVVGTSTTSDFKFTPTGLDLDDDIRFRVTARREIGGNLATDLGPSEEVFILFMSNMGDMGGTYENDWTLKRKDPTDGIFMTRWYWSVDLFGECSLGFYGDNSIARDTNTWALAYTPFRVPDLEGQSVAWCDGYISPGANWTSPTLGFCLGTLSEDPVQGELAFDFQPANDLYDPSYFDYNVPNCGGINDQFGETNQDAFKLEPNFGPPEVWQHVGFFMNDILVPGRDYFAIGYANGEIPLTPGTT